MAISLHYVIILLFYIMKRSFHVILILKFSHRTKMSYPENYNYYGWKGLNAKLSCFMLKLGTCRSTEIFCLYTRRLDSSWIRKLVSIGKSVQIKLG